MNASTLKLTKSPLGLSPTTSNRKPGFETRAGTETKEGFPDSMVLAVIFIACIYWVLDSILNIFFGNKFNLIAELIGPDLYDIYLRVIVLCLFVMFGSHAQSIINKLREAKQKLNESEELWRSLVATAPDVITAVDQKGIIRFVNQDIFKLGNIGTAHNKIDCFIDHIIKINLINRIEQALIVSINRLVNI